MDAARLKAEDYLIAQIEEHIRISKYLETENETEFFKQASVLFEAYIEKNYGGSRNRPTHYIRRVWFFNELSKNNIPWAMSAKRFIGILSKHRNHIMHNLNPEVDKELLRGKLIIKLKEVFSEIMGLKDGFPDDKNTMKREMIRFGKENLPFLDKDMVTKIEGHFGNDTGKEPITYDLHLYTIIITIYMMIYGTVEEIKQIPVHQHKQ